MAIADMADNADHNLHIDGFPVNGMSMLLHSSVYVLCCMVRAVTWSKDIVNVFPLCLVFATAGCKIRFVLHLLLKDRLN